MPNKNINNPFVGLSSFHLEADRCKEGLEILASGIVGIGDYSEEYLELKSHCARLKIKGKKMKLCVYENGSVEVKGRVEEMIFCYGKS